MIGLIARGIGVAVLANLCWHAWQVRAWTLLPISAALLVWLLIGTVRRWRALTRNRNTGFIRPNPPPFPEQAKRDIR